MRPAPEGWTPAQSDLGELLSGAGGARRIDQHGRALAAEDLRDKVVVVSFVAEDCSVVCILRARDLDAVARGLRGAAVFLTLAMGDARDAGRLRAFAEGVVGAASPLRFLANDPEGTARLAALLRYPAAALPEPPPQILLFDRRGQVAMTYGGDPVDGPRLGRDIALLRTFEGGLDARRDAAAFPGP